MFFMIILFLFLLSLVIKILKKQLHYRRQKQLVEQQELINQLKQLQQQLIHQLRQ